MMSKIEMLTAYLVGSLMGAIGGAVLQSQSTATARAAEPSTANKDIVNLWISTDLLKPNHMPIKGSELKLVVIQSSCKDGQCTVEAGFVPKETTDGK